MKALQIPFIKRKQEEARPKTTRTQTRKQTKRDHKLERFQTHLEILGKAKNTTAKYVADVRHCLELMGDPTTRTLTEEGLSNLIIHLKETYRPASVNSIIGGLNAYLTFIGCESLKRAYLKVPRKIFRREDLELTRFEYTVMLDAAATTDERLYHICETLGATGIRVTELKFITVTALYEKQAIVENKGKTRVVILPEKLIENLKAYAKQENITEGPLFTTAKGNPVDRSNLWRQLKALGMRAGIDTTKVFPHNFRHLFATVHYATHKNLSHLADVLGHRSIETTRIYIATSSSEHKAEIDALHLAAC